MSKVLTNIFVNDIVMMTRKAVSYTHLAPVTNLDWIFGNLMETEDGTQIIDYEWTFDVQVPVEYLIWRAVSLYLHSRSEL